MFSSPGPGPFIGRRERHYFFRLQHGASGPHHERAVNLNLRPSRTKTGIDTYADNMRHTSAMRKAGARRGARTAIHTYRYGYKGVDVSALVSRGTSGVFYTPFYNHAHRHRLEKLL